MTAALACSICICSWIYGQDPVHRRYTVADGLPSNTIFCALQDHEGFMWFGTDAGAVRFDGREFRTYGVEAGLTDNNVIKLAQDSKGRIWFLTMNGKLCYLLNDTVHNGRTDQELSKYTSPTGWATFVEDRLGMLWFGSVYDNVLRLDLEGDRDSLFFWSWPTRKPSVVLDDDGEAIVIANGRVFYSQGERWVKTDSLPMAYYQSDVLRGFDGRSPVLSLFQRGIVALDKGRWVHFLDDHFELQRHIRCWIDAAGDLWVALRDGGIDLRAKTPLGFAACRRLFSDEVVNFEYVDREFGRWICTARRGLIYCTNEEFQSVVFKGSAAKGEEPMFVLHRTADGGILVGSAEGGLYRSEGGTLSLLPADGLGRVLDMAEDPDGNVWIASDMRTLLLRKGASSFQEVRTRMPEPRSAMAYLRQGAKALEILPDGRIWAANFGFFEICDHEGRLLYQQLPDSINFRGRSLVPHVDINGRFWFDASEGLRCIENGRINDLSHLGSRMGLGITDIKSLPSGHLLIGTTGKGVLVLDSAARPLGELTMDDGLLSNDIVRIRVFHDTLLIATKQGSNVIIGPLIGSAPERSILVVQGLGPAEVNDAIMDGDRLLLATGAGLCSVPFPRKPVMAPPPLIYIAGVWVNGAKVSSKEWPPLTEGRDLVRIAFSTIAFADADKIEYQYRLRPDDAWSMIKDGVLELASLSHGSYVVAMRARRPGSGWSEPALVMMVVNAPWWQKGSTWIIGFVIIALFLVLITRRLLRRKYRRTLAELRQREALNKERSRIAADIHDDLGADLSRLLHYARRAEPNAGGAIDRPITDGLDRAIDKMDEIIWSLDPRRDTLQSTVQFIEQQAREAAEAHGLKFRADVCVPRSPVPLAATDRRELMLIAREAVRNIIDHADATTIWVEWKTMKDAVELIISDDGKGIYPASIDPARHGLHNMRERAEHLNGTLRIERRNASGTTVHLIFPLIEITRSDDAMENDDNELGR